MKGSDRPGLVLVFGENYNDSQSIGHLLVHLNPRLVGRVRPLPRPTSLTRQAKAHAVRNWVTELDRTIRGYEAGGRQITAALVHRDSDGPDPDGAVATALNNDLAPLGCGHPVVPVEEIEGWWFLFPNAVEAVRPSAWRDTMPRRARDVELIRNPKQELQRLTGRRKKARYEEADSPRVAEFVRQLGLQPQGTSTSYHRFRTVARSLT